MGGRRRVRGGETDDQLISRVWVEIDDLDRLACREIIVLPADRAEITSGGVENEKIVIGRYAASVEWIVPLKDQLAWIGIGRDRHHNRSGAARVQVLEAAGVERRRNRAEINVPRRLYPGRRRNDVCARVVAVIIAVSRRGKVDKLFAGQSVAGDDIIDGLGKNAVGEKWFVRESDVVHNDIASRLSRDSQLANAVGHRSLSLPASSEGDLRPRGNVVDDLGHG